MSTSRYVTKLEKQIDEIEQHLSQPSVIAENVSKVDTLWHLQHSVTVIKMVLGALKNSDPADFKPKFGLPKFVIMNSGYIPRGKGKAPKRVQTDEVKTAEQIQEELNESKQVLSNILSSNKKLCFKHPVFSWLNQKDTIKFLTIHTHHHLKIVRDIKNAEA
jgi:hypothetical protein